MTKFPWMKFFPEDYVRDTRTLTQEEKGCWMDLICHLWIGGTYGEEEMTFGELGRLWGCAPEAAREIILELERKGVCNAAIHDGNDSVTVVCRRMFREGKQLRDTYIRVRRFREKQSCNGESNDDVTPKVTVQKPKKPRSTEETKTKDVSSEPEKSPGVRTVPLMTFPTVGRSKEFHLDDDMVKLLLEAFPGLDALGECRKARVWLVANPQRQKTERGMKRFLFSWLERTQNRFGGKAAAKEPQREALGL